MKRKQSTWISKMQCPICASYDIVQQTIPYDAVCKRNGILHRHTVTAVPVYCCRRCNETIFTCASDEAIEAALQEHLRSGECRCAENSQKDG